MSNDKLHQLLGDLTDRKAAAESAALRGRVSDLERHEYVTSVPPGGGLPVTAGPDIVVTDVGGGLRQVGRRINTVLLGHADGSVASEFAATSAGLTAALAASASGDVIILPPQTITGGPWSVPAGVTLYGIDRRASILQGQLSGGDEAVIAHLTIARAASDGSDLIAVQGPSDASALLRLYDDIISATQGGAGNAYAVDVNDLGSVVAWGCELSGASIGGSGYAVRAQTGLATIRHSLAYGSTEPFLV